MTEQQAERINVNPVWEAAKKLVGRVIHLDNGSKAILRRGVLRPGNPRALAVLYRVMPPELQDIEGIAYTVATMIGFNNKYRFNGSMGKTMKLVRIASGSKSIDKRFLSMVDATLGEDLPIRLFRAVRIAASKEIGIGWTRLVVDLSRWNIDGKEIQKSWVRDYFARGNRDPEENEESEESEEKE